MRDRINNELKKLLFIPEQNTANNMNNENEFESHEHDSSQINPRPYVCIICDSLVKHDEVEYVKSSTLKSF